MVDPNAIAKLWSRSAGPLIGVVTGEAHPASRFWTSTPGSGAKRRSPRSSRDISRLAHGGIAMLT